MKTNLKSIVMALAAIMSFTLTSCEEDEFIALTLEGNWKGNMYVSYQFDNISGYHDASYSEVCFLRNPSTYTSGDGYWIDYYNDYARYGWGRNYIANHIQWTVDYGVIRIHFIEDGTYVRIRDYSLDDYYFTGSIELGDGGWQQFRLRHVDSPNWNNYYWGYDSRYYYDYYYYSNENKMGMEKAKAKNPEASKASDKPRRIFRARE